MTRFITKSLLLLSIYLLLVIGFNKYLFQKVHQEMYQGKHLESLIIGASTFIPLSENHIEHSLNLSQQASIYKNMYYKLIAIDDCNNFDNFIIPFDQLHISYVADLYLKGANLSYETVKRMYPITPINQLFTDNTRIRTVLEILLKYIFSINMEYFPIEGRKINIPFHNYTINSEKIIDYPKIKTDKLVDLEGYKASLESSIQWHYYPQGITGISATALKYLDKIVNYCEENNINLYLVSMPLHSSYQEEIPDIYTNTLEQLLDKYTKRKHVKYLDYADQFQDLEDTAHFYDLTHVSPYGGTIISDMINAKIN